MSDSVYVYYFSPYDIFRPRTNQIADIHLCEGFAENSCVVTLVAPSVHRSENPPKDRVLDSYGVVSRFKVLCLPTPFKDDSNGFHKRLVIMGMDLAIFFKIAFSRKGDRIIVSRSESLLWPMVLFKKSTGLRKRIRIVPWLHEIKPTRTKSWLLRNADAVMCTNSAIKDDLVRSLGLDPDRIFVTLNPISESQKAGLVSKSEARKAIGYFLDKPLVVYSGKLFKGQKEIEHILEAAALLPEIVFLFTGGQPAAVEHFDRICAQRGIHNCRFVGYIQDYRKIREYQFAADILVSYYSREEHDVRYNLPNKLCEYMLTGNPIITPDFPATRDVANESNVVFVEPENATALARTISDVVARYPVYAERAGCAFRAVQDMTFRNRAKLYLDSIGIPSRHAPPVRAASRGSSQPLRDVTFVIKTFERPRCLRRLLSSIERHSHQADILVIDDSREPLAPPPDNVSYVRMPFDSGLSSGRNRAIDLVRTEYFLLLDDDFVFTRKTRIERLRDLLSSQPFDIIGGAIRQNGVIRHREFHLRKAGRDVVASRTPVLEISPGVFRYHWIMNFFLARTERVREIGGWDARLKMNEHLDFFLRAMEAGVRVGYMPSVSIAHRACKTAPFYVRHRASSYFQVVKEKHRFSRLIYENRSKAEKIRDIILSVWDRSVRSLQGQHRSGSRD